jgi:hypothetical protein
MAPPRPPRRIRVFRPADSPITPTSGEEDVSTRDDFLVEITAPVVRSERPWSLSVAACAVASSGGKAGFTKDKDIFTWRSAVFDPEQSAAWKAHGFSSKEAKRWHAKEFTPENAQTWTKADMSLDEAVETRAKGLEPVKAEAKAEAEAESAPDEDKSARSPEAISAPSRQRQQAEVVANPLRYTVPFPWRGAGWRPGRN